jgi:hypothetical protein
MYMAAILVRRIELPAYPASDPEVVAVAFPAIPGAEGAIL